MRLMEGMVAGIGVKERSGAPLRTLKSVAISVENGLEGDHRGLRRKTDKRQVTLLSANQWQEACEELGVDLPWEKRLANILIHGWWFSPRFVGKHIHLANDAILEVTGETEPCSRMDNVHPGLKKILSSGWRGGVTCRVIRGGTVSIQQSVRLKLSS